MTTQRIDSGNFDNGVSYDVASAVEEITMMTPEQQRPVTFAAVREILDAASRSHKQTREGRRAEKAANAALASAKETAGAKERQAWLDLASLEAETARREAERAST